MTEYDYIIVGAGVAGSVLAARLSSLSDASVALIEAGDENPLDIGRSQGAFFLTWGGERDWAYETVPQDGLGGRSIAHPRGRGMGGSNVLNVGAWLRGRPEDYDAWEAAGAIGWNGDVALDVFRKVERTDRGPDTLRGHDGPIVMHDVATPTDLSERLRDAFVAAGLGQRGDSNGADPFVTDRYQTMFASGIRRTIADDFLTDEVRSRANFTIVTNTQVNRVLVDSGRATGVEVRDADGIHSITAGREVILCAGTFNTPQILMLSGIGPRDHLEELGIEVLVDAPAVGANLQDHVYTHIYTLAAAGVEGSVAPGMGEEDISAWLCDHTGPSGYFSENGVGWAALNGGSIPDLELLFSYTTTSANFGGITDAGRRSGTSIGVALLQPASRGTLRLASSDPTVKPVIDPCYLSEDADVTALVAGLRIAHRIAYEPVLAPWAQSVFPPITATDAELAAHVRHDATTVFHPVGTMRMGAEDDPTAAVDAELRVKGISGLRVVDASVMPRLIRGHTMAPTVVIAYRAADIINGQNMIVRR